MRTKKLTSRSSCGTKRKWASTRLPLTADQLRKRDHFLVKGTNAVPFDPSIKWKEGDMIPDYVLNREDAKGSAADNNAIASWKDGVWTVVIVRPLGLGVKADIEAVKLP